MLVSCFPTKELYRDFITNFRVISCIPTKETKELKLNRYGNFTLSGTNLNSLQLNQEANLVIIEDNKSKYEASYILLSYSGLEFEGKEIRVEPKYELEILSRLMEENQARNVNDAYPNFVSLVLNNKQDTIDFHKIHNVAQKRLDLYISKVQADCKAILFYPTAFDNGIVSSEDIRELQTHFNTPDELKNALSTNPYHVYVDLIGYSFDKADRLALKYHPEFIDSKERCEYGCLEILHENEYDGDTRINANLMASEAKKLTPEAKHHMVQAVTDSKMIHYDEATKYASIESTYQDELLIAEHILSRKNEPNPNFYPMDWQEFKTVDGFDCTDEQMAILKIIGEGGRVGILTGSGGTGKTSSVKALIRMLEANGHSYTLLAPTGVAAKRMRESTGRPASTIHMFLIHEDAEAGEYVIIDETSMVSVQLLASLLRKIGKDPNLIFVCDEAQLASISCGNIVQDLIDSGKVPRANLTKVFRYGVGGIATIATDARMGTMDNLSKSFNDFKFVPISSNPVEQVLEEYDKLIEKGYKKDEILVLSPYNKGHKGTYEINKAIQSRYNANDYTFASYQRQGMGKIQFKVGDMVLNTKNNYRMPSLEMDEDGYEMFGEMQCMNGDIGIVRECRGNEKDPMLIVQFDEGMAAISGSDIANLLLGYSVSIHKVQGAQNKAIIVVIDKEHKRLLSRNLMYVAFSRAQEYMVVIADEDVLKEGLEVQENLERDTWLGDMLKEGLDEQILY